MKTALVTGAGRGIGLKFVEKLLADGYRVIATTRKGEPTQALFRLSNPQLTFAPLDLSDEDSILNLAEKIPDTIDLLINNAGIMNDGDEGLEDLTQESLVDSFVVNAAGPLLVIQSLLPALEKSHQPIVVNITSQMGSIDDNKMGGYYGYRMSKAALNMANRSFSIDFPRITSVLLHPGWVKTDMGGAGATLTVDDSVNGMMNVIRKLREKDSGKFLNYRGEEIAW